MAALCLSVRRDGEWMLVHQCVECNTLKVNRIAGDDNALVLLRWRYARWRIPDWAREHC